MQTVTVGARLDAEHLSSGFVRCLNAGQQRHGVVAVLHLGEIKRQTDTGERHARERMLMAQR